MCIYRVRVCIRFRRIEHMVELMFVKHLYRPSIRTQTNVARLST